MLGDKTRMMTRYMDMRGGGTLLFMGVREVTTSFFKK